MRRRGLELALRDGGVVRAASFAPDACAEEAGPGVVLLAPPYALDERTAAHAAPLVDAGFVVLAPDLLARERAAGTPAPPDRRALAEVDAALARLGAEPGLDPARLALVGLGAGGTLAFLAACHSVRPSAVVSLGGRIVRDALSAAHPLQPLEMALNLGCPFLGIYGRDDPRLPAGELEHVSAVLSQFARTFDIVSLARAGPDFHELAVHEEGDREPARLAWKRAVEFLRECLE